MKILTASQIRDADKFSIVNEPISSIDLMERAASKCSKWISAHFSADYKICLFCGIGNNGGDGLAIARQLFQKGYEVEVYVIEFSTRFSEDFKLNFERLMRSEIPLKVIKTISELPNSLNSNDVVVDAIFGSGLNRPADGLAAKTIKFLNGLNNKVLSIDLPSGLFTEDNSTNKRDSIVKATYTLTFQVPKLALLLPENSVFVNNFVILDIGLDSAFIEEQESTKIYVTPDFIRSIIKRRRKFDHKGTFGHAMIIAGSKGKIGAAVLATKAALRSGVGLVTTHIPTCGTDIMQISVPEAMVLENNGEEYLEPGDINIDKYHIGIGPGIDQDKRTILFLEAILKQSGKAMVIDADALNILSNHPSLQKLIPSNSILTPHPKEFERLVGQYNNDTEKLEKQTQLAHKLRSVIILKGAHTSIALPDGRLFFNSTGNAGMATGGSGDVLTGCITSLLAQGYSSANAAILGVYLHGLAGDYAMKEKGEYSLIAGDIVSSIPEAYNEILTY
ncbi:MAG: NAD(P)H-hydrate dehydratase [Cytophagales bacterium]|nr:NAD(P)H-hydrate dehydratase [Cytophagales bacterium]